MIAIDFSLLSSVSKLLHVTFVYFPHLLFKHITFLLAYFWYLLLCHTGTSVHLPLPPSGYWYTSFFFLAGLGPPHEIVIFSVFAQSVGVCKDIV